MDLSIRAMTAADAPILVALASAQGWRDRTTFYDLMLRVPTCRMLVGEIDGRVIAGGIATVQGSVGWLGGLIVDAELRRRGIGRAMTENLIAHLRTAGCATLSLEATDQGLPMYEAMGFRLMTHYRQLQAEHLDEPPPIPAGATLRRLGPDDLPDIFALDRAATGEDRSAALAVLTEVNGGWALERPRGGGHPELAGFLMPAERAYGPVIAPMFEDGLFLLDFHRTLAPQVRAGVPEEHSRAWRELLSRGWIETWQAPRLIIGPAPEWRPELIWGQINSGMG
jgi:GNAT superfamily N-acetyltransferase